MMEGPHRIIQEKISTISEVYERLPVLDMELLGDASLRRPDLLDSYPNQKLRLMKLFALRKVIKCSNRARPILE